MFGTASLGKNRGFGYSSFLRLSRCSRCSAAAGHPCPPPPLPAPPPRPTYTWWPRCRLFHVAPPTSNALPSPSASATESTSQNETDEANAREPRNERGRIRWERNAPSRRWRKEIEFSSRYISSSVRGSELASRTCKDVTAAGTRRRYGTQPLASGDGGLGGRRRRRRSRPPACS